MDGWCVNPLPTIPTYFADWGISLRAHSCPGFCLNKAVECTPEFLQSAFTDVIVGSGCMLSVLEPFERPLPLFRAWCAYEMHEAFRLLPADGWDVIHSPEEEARMEEAVLLRPLAEMRRYIDGVDVMKATAFRAQDEAMIKAQLESLPGGAEAVNLRIRQLLDDWAWPFLDRLYKTLHAETSKLEYVHARFRAPGSLGIEFTLNGKGQAVVLDLIPGTQAENHTQLHSGLILNRVGACPISTTSTIEQVLKVIEANDERPLDVVFTVPVSAVQPQSPLAEAQDAAEVTVAPSPCNASSRRRATPS